MVKYELKLTGDFNSLVSRLHNDIMSGSVSVSCENGSDVTFDGDNTA